MTKGCGNHGNGEVSDGIVHPPPSFPRRRESKPLGDGNIQRLSESLGFYIPVFTGMTECCGNPACSVSVFFEVSGNF
ncbi:TPA: hypothetical protein ACFO0Y_001986 [Neisseria meningitidis]